MIHLATTDWQIRECYPVMVQLRAHLKADDFVETIRRMERIGYRLAFVESDHRPVAVAGYRISQKLSAGRFLYVDDLVTDEAHRSKGHGSRLLTWLIEQARAAGCAKVLLDSGLQRTEAHRFYEREGLRPVAYHFHFDC
jgi:GNAT superfamily N-acetyltransferase